MSRNKLYALLSTACAAGYIWIIITFYQTNALGNDPTVCLIKSITGVPCPSCGSTRSVLSIFSGHFTEALYWNPLGVVIVLILLIAPFWIAFDLVTRNDSLLRFYNQTELILKKRWVAIPAIILILVNWIWNIMKGL